MNKILQKLIEKLFLMGRFIVLYEVVVSFGSVDKIHKKWKAVEQFLVILFAMLWNVVLS